MASAILTCPECDAKLKLANPPQAGKSYRCPKCSATIVHEGDDDEATEAEEAVVVKRGPKVAKAIPAKESISSRAPKKAVAKAAVRRRDDDDEDDDDDDESEGGSKKTILLVSLIGVAALLVVGGAVAAIAIVMSNKSSSSDSVASRSSESSGAGSGSSTSSPGGPGGSSSLAFSSSRESRPGFSSSSSFSWPGSSASFGGALQAADLTREIAGNETGTKSKYFNKVITVRGTVVAVATKDLGPTVTLAGHNEGEGAPTRIVCKMNPFAVDSGKTLQNGSNVIIKGTWWDPACNAKGIEMMLCEVVTNPGSGSSPGGSSGQGSTVVDLPKFDGWTVPDSYRDKLTVPSPFLTFPEKRNTGYQVLAPKGGKVEPEPFTNWWQMCPVADKPLYRLTIHVQSPDSTVSAYEKTQPKLAKIKDLPNYDIVHDLEGFCKWFYYSKLKTSSVETGTLAGATFYRVHFTAADATNAPVVGFYYIGICGNDIVRMRAIHFDQGTERQDLQYLEAAAMSLSKK